MAYPSAASYPSHFPRGVYPWGLRLCAHLSSEGRFHLVVRPNAIVFWGIDRWGEHPREDHCYPKSDRSSPRRPPALRVNHAQTHIYMASAELGAAKLTSVVLLDHPLPDTSEMLIVQPKMMRLIAIFTLKGRGLSPAAAKLPQMVLLTIGTPHSTRNCTHPY